MVALLEMKNKIVRFYGKNEAYVTPLLKFVLALFTFILINANIGYMSKISSMPVALILAALCSILPVNGMIAIAAIVVLLNLYALSLEVCLVGFLLFALVYFVYFRFSPKYGYNAVLMPVCFKLGIPYIVPIGSGLLSEGYSVVSVVCGSVIYFFLNGVHANEATLSDAAEGTGGASKISIALNQFVGNREMYLVVAVFALATLIVYIVRKMDIDNAWTVAWVSGILFETIGLIAGYMLLGISGKVLGVVLGGIVSCALAVIIQFMFFNVDYTRTERLQFEDDEYYYYVKAVPKSVIAGSEKKVKHFNQKKDDKEAITKKRFAEEMEIDEELLG